MQFNFSYAQTVSKTQMTAFEFAGKIWSSYLTDDVTVNIAVDVQSSFPVANAIASAMARANQSQYSTFNNALRDDAKSSVDSEAINNNASRGGNFAATLQGVNYQTGDLVNSTQMGNYMSLNGANAKALNLNPSNGENVLDGYIVMRNLTGTGTSWNYNFTRTNTTPSTAIDFVGVALHEIGHVLGFQSSVDQPWVNPNTNRDLYTQSIGNRPNIATPLDLFRYSSRGGNTQVDLSPGATPFFSLDGSTALGNLQTGANTTLGGNGLQGSHWTSGGIMNAEVKKGMVSAISELDLNAFDAIGWDINPQVNSSSINYSQLYTQAQQVASTKQKNDISNAVGLMLDSSDIYLQTTGAETLGGNNARTGSWWQELFARTGSWWQELSKAISSQAVFETLAEGLGEPISSSNQEALVQYANDYTNSKDVDLLTGKAEGAMLVGEDSFVKLDVAADSQFIDFGFTQPFMDFQKNGLSILDQPPSSQGFESVTFTSTISNVVLGVSNQSQLSSISTSSQLIADAFTPWWLGDTSWWTVK